MQSLVPQPLLVSVLRLGAIRNLIGWHLAARAACQVSAFVYQYAHQPGPESRIVAQITQIAPGLPDAFLHRILTVMMPAQQRCRHAVHILRQRRHARFKIRFRHVLLLFVSADTPYRPTRRAKGSIQKQNIKTIIAHARISFTMKRIDESAQEQVI